MFIENKKKSDSVFGNSCSATAPRTKPFLDRLESLYVRMDGRYQAVSRQYGFQCRGCEDNCCKTTFYHHTLVEYLYLKAGFQSLDPEAQAAAFHRARIVHAQPHAGLFCPLCREERCLVYAFRPMICRLHGIAHEIRRPDRTVSQGPGCAAFEAVARGKPYIAFDRTDFYWDLSRLERDARAALGVTEKLKKTVSRMVIDFQKNGGEKG